MSESAGFILRYQHTPGCELHTDVVIGTAMKSCIHRYPTHLDQKRLRPPKLNNAVFLKQFWRPPTSTAGDIADFLLSLTAHFTVTSENLKTGFRQLDNPFKQQYCLFHAVSRLLQAISGPLANMYIANTGSFFIFPYFVLCCLICTSYF